MPAAPTCPACHAHFQSGDTFCGACGYALPVQPVVAAAARPYFIHPAKLAILSVLTLGIYEIFWAYKHWNYLKHAQRRRIRPVWRAIFLPLFAYHLFKYLGQRRAGWYAALYIGLTLVALLSSSWALSLSLMAFLPLYWTQQQVNHRHGAPETLSLKFGSYALIGTIMGLALWAYVISNLFGGL